MYTGKIFSRNEHIVIRNKPGKIGNNGREIRIAEMVAAVVVKSEYS